MKTKIYSVAGIPEHWVINLRTVQLIIFRQPTKEGCQSQEILTHGSINPLAFPDIAISIDKLLVN